MLVFFTQLLFRSSEVTKTLTDSYIHTRKVGNVKVTTDNMANGIHDGVPYQLVSGSQTIKLIATSEVRTSSCGRHYLWLTFTVAHS